MEDGSLLITKPVRKPRAGWEERLRKMAEAGEDKLMLDFPTASMLKNGSGDQLKSERWINFD